MDLELSSCCWGCLEGRGDLGHSRCINNPHVHAAHRDGRLISNVYDGEQWIAVVDVHDLDLLREARRGGTVTRVDYLRARYAARVRERQNRAA